MRSVVTQPPPELRCHVDVRRDCASLERFYAGVGFTPVWLADPASKSRAAAALTALRSARSHGLDPRDYDVDALAAEVASVAAGTPPAGLARADARLTVALLQLVGDVHSGRVDPRTLHPELKLEPKPFDPVPLLRNAAEEESGLERLLERAAPPYSSYRRLVEELARYRDLGGRSLTPLPPLPASLHPGAPSRGLESLRERLLAEGDLAADAAVPSVYEGELVAAVERFQARHGLQDDGVIGSSTFAALSVPLADRASQIEWALERIRWFPVFDHSKLIVVNIPEFELWAVDLDRGVGRTRFRTAVVVGRAANTRTPLLVASMRSIDFNPYWNVPHSIVRKELLQELRRDPGYLARAGMEIIPAHPAEYATASLSAETLARLDQGALRIRQRPGPQNALGRVKFNMPNGLDIYLHDTPQKQLFVRARRDFSHGCIRVAEPVRLAAFLLEGQSSWGEEAIRAAMASGKSAVIPLDHPVPVVLFYSTVVPEPGGRLHFLPDLYGYDAALRAALASRTARLTRSL